jgi:NTE family protein
MIEIDGVFEGGGAKGTAYIGALNALRESGIWFKRVAGSSAGAITASLIAAGYESFCDNEKTIENQADYSAHQNCLQGIVCNTDFNTFKDKPRFGFLNLLNRSGFYKGDAFLSWIEKRLADKLKVPQPSFSDLPIDLSVVVSDITNERFVILNRKTTPTMRVALAVRMSMSIPFFFRVVKWQGEGEYQSDTTMRVVDGGLLSNYPVWLFDSENEFVSNTPDDKKRPTIGFLLVDKPDDELDGELPPQLEGTIRKPKAPATHRGFSLMRMITGLPVVKDIGSIIDTLLVANDNRYIQKAKWANTIPIFTNNYGTTQFDLSKQQKDDLMRRGRLGVERRLREILAIYGITL